MPEDLAVVDGTKEASFMPRIRIMINSASLDGTRL
jgi:hypothetical protein